jgi:hypothetical protein
MKGLSPVSEEHSHFASTQFWDCYDGSPESVRARADKQFALLKEDPSHPSLHFKRVGRYLSARVNDDVRVLGMDIEGGILWFWMGRHDEYTRMIRR